mgnify:CR=1 FL=1
MNAGLARQLRENAVALTSLTLVVIGLAYNTCRKEQTEFNDNIRAAVLAELAGLE